MSMFINYTPKFTLKGKESCRHLHTSIKLQNLMALSDFYAETALTLVVLCPSLEGLGDKSCGIAVFTQNYE